MRFRVRRNNLQENINKATSKANLNGYLTIGEFGDIFDLDIINQMPSDSHISRDTVGWDADTVRRDDMFIILDEFIGNPDEIFIEVPFVKELHGPYLSNFKASFTENVSDHDHVCNPAHYIEGRKYEPRKVIYDWGLNFNLGNAVKYLSRAGRKEDKVEDLKKAIKYIEFELEELEGKKE